ncbi:tyrosine-type recombinase/integrase, partial [Paraburkholderia hiiakae]
DPAVAPIRRSSSGPIAPIIRWLDYADPGMARICRSVTTGRDRRKPMSGAAINAALQRLGFDTKTEITGHGFRAMARTILHERLRFPAEVIEHQLAHRVPDSLGGAYNRTRFIDDRVAMMQAWADYLDRLKAGAEVVPIRQRDFLREGS